MIKNIFDLKPGDYVISYLDDRVEVIESVNSQYAYTSLKNRIYPKDKKYWFQLTEREAKARVARDYNNEVLRMRTELEELASIIHKINNNNYVHIDTDSIEDEISYLLDSIKEDLIDHE